MSHVTRKVQLVHDAEKIRLIGEENVRLPFQKSRRSEVPLDESDMPPEKGGVFV